MLLLIRTLGEISENRAIRKITDLWGKWTVLVMRVPCVDLLRNKAIKFSQEIKGLGYKTIIYLICGHLQTSLTSSCFPFLPCEM